MNKVRVVNAYWDWDGIWSSVNIFKSELDAFNYWMREVRDYLLPTFRSYDIAHHQSPQAAQADCDKKITEFLQKVEYSEDHYLKLDDDISCRYNPHDMTFEYSHYENDSYWCIEWRLKDIE